MNYARYRLEETNKPKTFGKHKKAPPAVCIRNTLGGDDALSTRDGATSVGSSPRSSAYRAVEEAAAARTAMLNAEAEAKRALARLADTRAECNEQHQAITTELEAMQKVMQDGLRNNSQQQTVQAARVDAMGHRLEEMKELLLQRELRMEVQVAEWNTQIQALSAAAHGEQPKPGTSAADIEVVPASLPIKTSPKTTHKASRPPEVTKKHLRVQVKLPGTSSVILLPTPVRTKERVVDPIFLDSSTIDLTDTRATAGSHVDSAEDNTFATA